MGKPRFSYLSGVANGVAKSGQLYEIFEERSLSCFQLRARGQSRVFENLRMAFMTGLKSDAIGVRISYFRLLDEARAERDEMLNHRSQLMAQV